MTNKYVCPDCLTVVESKKDGDRVECTFCEGQAKRVGKNAESGKNPDE